MAGLVQPHPADNETIATVMQRHGDTAHTHTHTLIRTTGSRRACAVSLFYLFICLLAGTGVESASQAIRACLAVVEALQLHSHLQTRVETQKVQRQFQLQASGGKIFSRNLIRKRISSCAALLQMAQRPGLCLRTRALPIRECELSSKAPPPPPLPADF